MNRDVKKSQLDWIETIPSEWKTAPLKTLFSFGKGLSIAKADLVEDGFKVISYGQIHSKIASGTKIEPQLIRFIPQEIADYAKASVSNIGDIIVADTSEDLDGCGNAVYVDIEGVAAGYHTILMKNNGEVDGKYIAYQMKTDAWRKQVRSLVFGVKVYSVTQRILKRTSIILPPIEEQIRISGYLDYQCVLIDHLSENLTRQIDVLKEYKNALITQAVTKGLDPNVEMKDSGIEWIENIPASWSVKKIYSHFSERKHVNTFGQEDNRLSLSYGKIVPKRIDDSDGLVPESYNTYNIVEIGDIVIRPTDLQNDKRSLRTGLVKIRGIITSAYITLKPKAGGDTRYFHYLLHCFDELKVFYNLGNGVRQGLTFDIFKNLPLLEPTAHEQKIIADFLDEKCQAIDSQIKNLEQQKSTLAEYKKSLIFDYVTGKKEVPTSFGEYSE